MRIFISYSRQDFAHAEALHRELKAAGYQPWLDRLDILHGEPWREAVASNIASADLFLLVVSPWSLASEQVRGEWKLAQRQQKETLLLVVESLKRGAENPIPVGQSWIDLRTRPLEATSQVKNWLSDSHVAQKGPLPLRPVAPFFFTDAVPLAVHFAAWAQIIGSMLFLALSALFLVWLVRTQLVPTLYVSHVDKWIVFGWTAMSTIAMFLGQERLRYGVLIYHRELSTPVRQLKQTGINYFILMITLLLPSAAIYFLGSLLDSTLSSRSLLIIGGYGVVTLLLGLTIVLVAGTLGRSEDLRRWLPAYSSDVIDTVFFISRILARSRVLRRWLPTDTTTKWKPPARYDKVRTKGENAEPIIKGLPVRAVTLLYARQDAPFARGLEKFLFEQDVLVHQGQPEVNADGAVILVLTPWSTSNSEVNSHWCYAMDAGIPVIPVLLEDAELPPELSRLNWIDARDDIVRAHQDVMDVLRGEPLPRPQAELKAPPRRSSITLPGPKQIGEIATPLMLPFALKLSLIAIFYPLALWEYQTLPCDLWIAGGTVFIVGYIQAGAMGLFVTRGLSYKLFVGVQAVGALVGLALLAFIWPELRTYVNFPLSTGWMLVLLGLAEIIPLGLLLSRPECREWAVGGLTLARRGMPPLFWLSGLGIAAVAVILFCLPVLATWRTGQDIGMALPTIQVENASQLGLVSQLNGHTGVVTSVAWSPDSTMLASTSVMPEAVWVRNLGTKKILEKLEGDFILLATSAAWSPDGTMLTAGGFNATIPVWDWESGQPPNYLEGHNRAVYSVAWSPDGTKLASGSDDWSVRVWDWRTGQAVAHLEGHTDTVHSVTWSPDGVTLASGGADNVVQVWDWKNGRELARLEGHTDSVLSVAWSPDGSLLASGGSDKTVLVWDWGSGQVLTCLKGHADLVRSVAWSPDGALLASGSADNTVRVWDWRVGQLLSCHEGQADTIMNVAWSPDGKMLAAGAGFIEEERGVVWIWGVKP